MPVKKNQFVQMLAERWSVSKKQAGETLDSTLDELVKVLKTGQDRKLNLSGFGVFKVVDRPARMARNPRTGSTEGAGEATAGRRKNGAGTDARA